MVGSDCLCFVLQKRNRCLILFIQKQICFSTGLRQLYYIPFVFHGYSVVVFGIYGQDVDIYSVF